MVDRAELRHELKRLACDAEAPRILKVTGDQGTGKSFSLELISHLCEKLPPEQRAEFVLLDYSRHRDPVEAVDIANTIATRMKMLNVLPVRSDQPQASKWAALFIDAWVAEVRTSPSSWWVVIDGLNSATLTQDAQDLIGELALQVHYCLPSVRLVLLGYRGNLFPQTHISEERIKPIVLEDLEAFIAKALSERQIEKDPKDMAQSASEVWEQIKQNDTYLLHKLPECLKAVLK